jgi:hypothetical protein
MRRIIHKIAILFLLITHFSTNAQENTFSRNSIKTGVGIGFNEGANEEGLGTFSTIGFERSYGKHERIRINANILLGGFTSGGIDDGRENYYRNTSLNFNLNYDCLKYKAVSLFLYSGGFTNYSRGMLGSGYSQVTFEQYDSRTFANLYYGVNLGGGFRINPKNNRCAFEIKPFNLQMGNKEAFTFYMLFGVDIKIKK